MVTSGTLAKPMVWDPMLEILRERGALHEQEYIDHLAGSGFALTLIPGRGVAAAPVASTIDAMRAGAQAIVQGALASSQWGGRADILRRVEEPSDLGDWSYEVIDTKLARATKGGTVLQLCLYSDLVARVQGRPPDYAYVVAPLTEFQPERFRVSDFAAYYRLVRGRLVDALANTEDVYPEPVAHCEICRWRKRCDDRRHDDDHLSLVAGISKVQRAELTRRGASTMTALAALPLPLPWKPERGAISSYERIREQARIQVEGRDAGAMLFEPLSIDPGFGLTRLPAPSDGDVFFDLEGDPFVGDGGLEFLFGYAFQDGNGELVYVADWSFSRTDEKAAFERFVDFVTARRQQYPDLHIYHYAPYEPGALKRLMGRYASREEEIDGFLRGQVLIDLYSVVRHAIRASVESYSIKKLEALYGFIRSTPLNDANYALTNVAAGLELGDLGAVTDADRTVVAGYNRDDCVSTRELRDWLENLRDHAIAQGSQIDRPAALLDSANPEITAWHARIDALVQTLTKGLPADVGERTPEQQVLISAEN